MIHVTDTELEIILDILKAHAPEGEVWAFGSRQKGTHRKHSDLDLAVVGHGKQPLSVIGNLKEAFMDSTLPYRVDVLDYHAVLPSFSGIIDAEHEVVFKKISSPSMTLGWQTSELRQLAHFIDYRGKTPPKQSFGIPLVTAKIIKNNTIQNPQEFIASDFYDTWMTRGIPKQGDVIFTTEAPLGEVALIKTSQKLAFAQRVIILQANPKILNNKFLFYALQHTKIKNRIDAKSSGTTVFGIKSSELKKVEIDYPSIKEQQAIAATLSCLDDKIELNNKINANLEAQAQAIFKSWFVDFEPFRDGEFVDSELGPIPKGWRVVNLSDLCSLISRGITPKYAEDSNQIVINQKCIRNHEVSLHPSRKHLPKVINEKWLKYGDILVNSTGQGTLGRTAQWLYSLKNVTVDSHITIIRAVEKEMQAYLGQLIMSREAEIEAMASGSTGQTELSKDRLGGLSVVLPTDCVLVNFSSTIQPMMAMRNINNHQSRQLAQIRDALLPKLISGEIEVPVTD